MNRKLIEARRAVERLQLQATGERVGANPAQLATALKVWEAGNVVADLEAADRESAVRTARAAARAMDVVLAVVAVLTMAFSLKNIHDFAADHAVQEPIGWFLAPAVDLALVAALMGDAVLSRWQLDAGAWATRLRWYAGGATLVLNTWDAWASLDAAAIVLHTATPVLLFVLAEAASPYRMKFAETVKRAAATADTLAVSTPADTEADTEAAPAATVPAEVAGTVYDQEVDPAVSTMTPQEDAPAPLASVPAQPDADGSGVRLDAAAARQAIETAWEDGLTIREAATRATRSASYVGGVYAQLNKARGGQTAISEVA